MLQKLFNRSSRKMHKSFISFLIEKEKKVLEISSNEGAGLSEVISDYSLINYCQDTLPELKKSKADYVILNDVIGFLKDIQESLENLAEACHNQTRIIVSYYTKHWEPLIRFVEFLGLKKRNPLQNFLSSTDIEKLLELSGYEVIRREYQQLVPFSIFGLGYLINKFIGVLPGIRRLCFRTYIVARKKPELSKKELSVSIIIPCRNEKGNIEAAITRLSRFGSHQEIIFVEGHSRDGTWEEVQRVQKAYGKTHSIKVFQQPGKGKADAVHLGFRNSENDILMILDADLTMPPEQLEKFYNVIRSEQGEFVNGTRLIYPLEDQSMRFLNFVANKAFSWIFSFLLSQRFTDTLCGTKVFFRKDYERFLKQREFFGDFDPFGDFELIFAASKLNLKVVEVPIRYQARSYGETQISRFRHGFILLKMVIYAFKKLKLQL